jgi:N6-L-threonylcarbamoyladenine synthase
MQGRAGCDVSLSGLKTAVRQIVLADNWQPNHAAALAQQFHHVVAHMLTEKLKNASTDPRVKAAGVQQLVFAGGVAANQFLRAAVQNFCEVQHWAYAAPPINLCTDNAVMIGWVGALRFDAGQRDMLDVAARPRWPLSELSG